VEQTAADRRPGSLSLQTVKGSKAADRLERTSRRAQELAT
jgi:hypothetical protein